MRAMKKYIYIISAAAVCLLAACAKEITEPKESAVYTKGDVTYIHANVGTRATLDNNHADQDTSFTWNTGDQIAIYADGYQKSKGLDSQYNGSPTASFAFQGVADADRADFAVFPAHLVFDGDDVIGRAARFHSETNLSLALPESYEYGQVTWYKTPAPMIAVNAPGQGLAFKALCPVLRIILSNIPKDTRHITFDFNGKKVQGNFTLSGVDLSDLTTFTGLQTEDTDDVDDIITVNTPNITSFMTKVPFTLPIPAGEYDYVTISTLDENNNVISAISHYLKVEGGVAVPWNAGRKASKRFTTYLPSLISNTKTGTRVVLAPGNLQATLKVKAKDDGENKIGACNIIGFAPKQYIALGDCSGNRFAAVGDTLDLFCWIGESAEASLEPDQYWGIVWPNNPADADIGAQANEYIMHDWGEALNGKTVDGHNWLAGTWRLPNKDKTGGESVTEWGRICYGREGSYVSCKATLIKPVEGADADTVVRGVLVFPDDYRTIVGLRPIPGVPETFVNSGKGKMNTSAAHYKQNVLTLQQWEILEKFGGCWFLPVTSNRIRSGGANCSINFGDAAYWTNMANNSTQHAGAAVTSDTYVCAKSLNGNNTTTFQETKSCGRKNGCAVRLVREVR